MENNYYIYKHTAPNGKVYIGQTCQKLDKRFGKNGCNYKGCTLFYNAIQKYGFDNFKHEVIFDGLTKIEANEKEIDLIREYRSNEREFGYNIQGGGNNSGSPSEESGKKMSEWQIGKVLSEDTKKKISDSRIGQKDSIETRIKKSNGHKGKSLSEETKLKLSKSRAEKVTDEQIERVRKIGRSNKGRTLSKETRNKMSDAHKGIGSKRILCIETNILYSSISEASKCTNINRQNIGKVCNGKLQTAGGYHWTFL